MWFYEALGAALFFSIAGILFKADNRDARSPHVFLFCLYAAGSLSLLAYILAAKTLQLNFRSIAAGIVIGAGIGAGNYLFAKALKLGPISLTSPIINLNVVFLVAGAVLWYGEPLNLKSGLLVALLILSLLILTIDPQEKISIHSRTWYLLVILASLFFAVRNGGLKVTNELGIDPDSVLFIGYLGPALWFYLAGRRSGPYAGGSRSSAYGGIAGLFSVAGMILYSVALQNGPASLVIPLFSTYNVFIVVLACLVFRERLSRLQLLSVAIVVVSVALLR